MTLQDGDGGMIQTVLGLVPARDIGVADAHAHLWIEPPPGVPDDSRTVLNEFDAIRAELLAYHAAGGTLAVDCQPSGAGRGILQLVRLSRATGLHVTTTTGFHLRKYYAPDDWLWSASAEKAADYFVHCLTMSLLQPKDTRATTIKVGYAGEISGQTRVLMEAAAEAARQTGAVVLFHTEAGRNVEALLPFFSERGVPPTQLYLCHIDKRPDLALHRELAGAGVLLGYDTFARPKYDPERNVWTLLPAMIAHGCAGQIALGLDLSSPAQWRFGGGAGMQMIPDVIIPRLRAQGVDDATVRGLTGQNIARFLVRRAVQ